MAPVSLGGDAGCRAFGPLIRGWFPWQGEAGKPQGANRRGGTVIVWIKGCVDARPGQRSACFYPVPLPSLT